MDADYADAVRLRDMLRAEVRRLGLSMPPRWNEPVATAMLGSVSGAIVVYGVLLMQAGGSTDDVIISTNAKGGATRQYRSARRHSIRALLGLMQPRPGMLRRWHALARQEGNPAAGGDLVVERHAFTIGHRHATHEFMDNGDTVVRLRCYCGEATARRWRAVALPKTPIAETQNEARDFIDGWHADCAPTGGE